MEEQLGVLAPFLGGNSGWVAKAAGGLSGDGIIYEQRTTGKGVQAGIHLPAPLFRNLRGFLSEVGDISSQIETFQDCQG